MYCRILLHSKSKMASFTGQVALITGSTSSIGEATARRLASSGCLLALTGKEQDDLMELARQCQRLGASEQQILLLAGDLTDDKNAEEVVTRTVKKFGRLDILVHNLSWDSIFGDKDKTPSALFDEVLRLNVRSVFYLTKLAAPHLVESQVKIRGPQVVLAHYDFLSGCIVSNYNVPTFTSSSEKLVYSTTKVALEQFMRSLAVDLAPKGVRINAVNPGVITNREINAQERSFPGILKASREGHPLGKHSKDKEAAAAIGFLASHDAAMISGELLTIDGGWHIRPGAPKD